MTPVQILELGVVVVCLYLLYRACASDVAARRHRVTPHDASAAPPSS